MILFLLIIINSNRQTAKNKNTIETNEEKTYENVKEDNEVAITDTNELGNINEENETWKIEIPEISLIANISEGTDDETLKKYVGHFSSTPKEEGNIGLAAHNRGYSVNYFENLEKLKGGEEITYTYGEFRKTYVVTQNIKISDIDWSYLENSNENKITLITCIENEPAYRRCVQAIEKEEK